MPAQFYRPDEVLFSPSLRCNLHCAHCDTGNVPGTLSATQAVRFLKQCPDIGIKRVGFTGGEPFLVPNFLCAVIRAAIRCQLRFSRIMTNGAWFENLNQLRTVLRRLANAGYDGDFCVSVDAFHRGDLKKVSAFIRHATVFWGRPDLVSIASVRGALEKETRKKLTALSRLLDATLCCLPGGRWCMKNNGLFLKITDIQLSSVGKVEPVKNSWGKKWFRDDFCLGPGNIFFVLPDGTVKPCCGYANHTDLLTLGSIQRDSPRKLLRSARKNLFVRTIFSKGLHPLRKKLKSSGIRFPGKTSDHCVFCGTLAEGVPRPALNKSLRSLFAGPRPKENVRK